MKKPKYNIGDKVRVVKGESIFHGLTWVGSMDDRVGRVFTIKTVHPHNDSVSYELENDLFYYDERWLKPEREEKRSGFKAGDRILFNGKPATVVYKYPPEKNGGYLIRYDHADEKWSWNCAGTNDLEAYYRSLGADPKAGNVYWNVCQYDEMKMKPLKGKSPYQADKKAKRHIIIEITDDGAEAKYIDGKDVKKTASVRRHPDDEPNDYHAARYVLGKMFGKIQLAEKHEKDISEALGWLTGSVQTMEKAREKLIEIVKETKGGGK